MIVKHVSISNFRSFKKTVNIPISNFSVFIGANNAGKSSILHALYFIQNTIENNIRLKLRKPRKAIAYRGNVPRQRIRTVYNPETDLPLNYKNNVNKQTIFQIEFILTNKEKKTLKNNIEHYINNNKISNFLPEYVDDRISERKLKYMLKNNEFKISGDLALKITLSEKYDGYSSAKISIHDTNQTDVKYHNLMPILLFIINHIRFYYIPSVRTTETLRDIILDLLSEQLLKKNSMYKKKFEDFYETEQNELNKTSKMITEEVSKFWPDIKNINFIHSNIGINTPQRYSRMLRLNEIQVDDGINTALELKGDGIQNIIIILIMNYLANSKNPEKKIFLMIEEPESHLHQDAIHKLRDILKELSSDSQVIISTHSTMFIDREKLSNNILVEDNSVKPVKNIASIRNALGITIDENFQNTKTVVLVEGETDVEILERCINDKSKLLKKLIRNKKLVIIPSSGVAKLKVLCATLNLYMCEIFLLLDNDDEAIRACEKVLELKLIHTGNIILCKKSSQRYSEIEDFVIPKYYSDQLKNKYKIKYKPNKSIQKLIWSKRMKKLFDSNNKYWGSDTNLELKKIVANSVKKNGYAAMIKKENPIQALIKILENHEK